MLIPRVFCEETMENDAASVELEGPWLHNVSTSDSLAKGEDYPGS